MKNFLKKISGLAQASILRKFKKLVVPLVPVILLVLLALPIGKASAEGVGLKLSPSVLELKTVTPNIINAPITIENLNDEPANLRVEFRRFQADQESTGQISFSDEPVPDFFKNIAIIEAGAVKTDLVIGPGQKKNLTLQITLDDKDKPSDHYFSVIFTRHQDITQTDDPGGGLHAFTRVNLGIAMNVLLSVEDAQSVNGITTENLIIEEFGAPSFVNKGPIDFTVKIQNNGSQYIKSKGSIYITNMFGQLIGKVDLPSQNVLANSSRYLGSVNRTGQSDLSPLTSHFSLPSIVWQETFLLGPYDVVLEIETGPDSEPIRQSIRFIAIPIKTGVFITSMIILGLIIRQRARKKMSGN